MSKLERAVLVGGQVIFAHPKSECSGTCAIHNPSNHCMKDFPQNWRSDIGVMERMCKHGVGHDDPDHVAYVKRTTGKYIHRHGCCGCCSPRKLSTLKLVK